MILPFIGNFRITQNFNDSCCRVSYAKFGLKGHNGIDYGLPAWTPVYAPHAGRITEALFDANGYGNYVKIDDGAQASILAHLARISIALNTQVSEGQLIGYSGNTGNSTGAHLHWGYYRNPRNRNNGFNGYIDQTPYLNGTIHSIPQPMPTDPTAQPMRQVYKDIHRAMTGKEMPKDTEEFRVKQSWNTIQVIEDYLKNDGDAKTRWGIGSTNLANFPVKVLAQAIVDKT